MPMSDGLNIVLKLLEADSELSLVWGSPQQLTEKGIAGEVVNAGLGNPVPQKADLVSRLISQDSAFPEGNLLPQLNPSGAVTLRMI